MWFRGFLATTSHTGWWCWSGTENHRTPRTGLLRSCLICCLAAVMPCACELNEINRPRSARLSLAELEADFWEWRMRDAPFFSTAVGETEQNNAVESFSRPVYQQRKTVVLHFLHRLQGVDREELDSSQQLDYDIFTDHLLTYLDGTKYNDYFAMNSVNFLEGINADPGRMQIIMPLSTLGDFENYLERLLKFPQKIDQKIELLKAAVCTGLTQNRVSVMGVPAQIDSLVEKEIHENDFYQPAFTTTLDEATEIPDDKKLALRSRAKDAVEKLNDSLGRLKTYLEESYLAATRPTWGLRDLQQGQEMYQRCLRYHTSTCMTPQEVHDLGLQEVARIHSNMQAALKRLNFTGTIKQFYDGIRNDPKFHLDSSEELLETYNDMVFKQIFPKMHTMFKDIPDLPMEVRAMPYDGPGGVYLSGTPDGSVPGIFYANVMRPEDVVTIGMMSLVLHETIPGHHMQSIYSLTSNIPKYRAFVEDDHYYRMPATFPINTAYIEGWGLYAEYLGEELGLYTDDYMLMGRYSEEIFRACRLVVDTGLHYFGWDREQAIQYMLDNTAMDSAELTTEVDRYLTWPGQATAYKIGEIKIKQLRQRATDSLGKNFNLADFHSVVLKNGGMPLDLLERLVVQWIDEVKATNEGTVTKTAVKKTARSSTRTAGMIPGRMPDALIG